MANIRSLLSFGMLSAAFASPSRRSVCNAGRQTIDGKQYTISCGLDRPGGDYASQQTSFDGCFSACNADSRCVTAQYHEDNGFCYLKSTVDDAALESGGDTIDHDVACKQDTTVVLSGLLCQISCGIDRPGGDYALAYVGNYLACAQACAADANCLTAQYRETNGFCYFKNVINDAVTSDVADSVFCDRTPASSSTTSTSAKSSSTTTTTATSAATGNSIGQSCVYNKDCASGICTSTNYCGPTPNSYSCGSNADCQSGYCDIQSYGFGYCQNAASA